MLCMAQILGQGCRYPRSACTSRHYRVCLWRGQVAHVQWTCASGARFMHSQCGKIACFDTRAVLRGHSCACERAVWHRRSVFSAGSGPTVHAALTLRGTLPSQLHTQVHPCVRTGVFSSNNHARYGMGTPVRVNGRCGIAGACVVRAPDRPCTTDTEGYFTESTSLTPKFTPAYARGCSARYCVARGLLCM